MKTEELSNPWEIMFLGADIYIREKGENTQNRLIKSYS